MSVATTDAMDNGSPNMRASTVGRSANRTLAIAGDTALNSMAISVNQTAARFVILRRHMIGVVMADSRV